MGSKNIHHCDVIIIGAGIAGLWVANRLKRAGYHVVVVEKDKIGGVQTLASQGMIHGGQKYAIEGKVTGHAQSIAAMPARWQDCFDGCGEIDLTGVKFLSDTQVMWPAGGMLADVAVFGAAKLVNAATVKLKKADYPDVLMTTPKFKGPVYALPEKVLDIRSLLEAMVKPLDGRIFQGEMTEILPDGQVAISGHVFQAQLVVATAGAGNEDVFRALRINTPQAQRRPLRQIMVRHLDFPLYGHGIVGAPKPRVTVTAHPDGPAGYVWYLGGAVAEDAAGMDDTAAINHAAAEMAAIFPGINWAQKEWATWAGDRAEPYNPDGRLPQGPHLQQRGRILVGWPTKLTFAPLLADKVIDWLRGKDVTPAVKDSLPDLRAALIGSYPWEVAVWRTLP